MTRSVYINSLGAFLPGEPVPNDRMEEVLGRIGERNSRARLPVLRNNRISQRHYVLDPETGEARYNNAQLTAEAIRRLGSGRFALDELQLLACGTSSPDQLAPGHGVMVHGELGSPPCEVASAAGICVSGVSALKYAYMAVAAGMADNAVAAGSEVVSTFMRARHFDTEPEDRLAALEQQPEVAFEKDFLRWMLSDGAGAWLLQPEPWAGELALRIDWIELVSFANEQPACMYAGARKEPDGTLTGWRELGSAREAFEQQAMAVSQDVRQLNENIVHYTVERALDHVRRRRLLEPDAIDWFLPHYSSHYFRDRLHQGLRNADLDIPQERWFTNLYEVGNVGSASIYLILEQLARSGRIREGETLLCHVPESGRFSAGWIHLTAVAP